LDGGTKWVGILVVGNEILEGLVLDTNSHWVINRLKALNLRVKERMTVRDVVEEIALGIRRLLSDGCSLIITIGGLGPTHDDVTLRGVAEALGLQMELNEEALEMVSRRYRELYSMGLVETGEITDARRKMAVLPRGARPLENLVGGAPGVVIDLDGGMIISLPGVPEEMRWIFENRLIPLLGGGEGAILVERIISLSVGDETTLSPMIDEVMRSIPNIYVKSMVKPYGESSIRIWITATGASREEAEDKIERALQLLSRLLERHPSSGDGGHIHP